MASFEFKSKIDFDKPNINLFFTKVYYGELSEVQIIYF